MSLEELKQLITDAFDEDNQVIAALRATIEQQAQEIARLRGALEEIKDMPQGELQAAMNEGDTLHILGCMANLFNSCRDIAQQALATPDANKKVPHD